MNAGAAHNLHAPWSPPHMPVRVSNHALLVSNAARTYQDTYRFHSNDLNFVSPTVNTTVGDLIAVTIPMGRRDRLYIITTFAQLLISYDTRSDILQYLYPDDRPSVRLMRRVQSAINGVFYNGVPPASSAFLNSTNAHEIVLRPVLDAMVVTDHDFARTLVAEMIDYFFNKSNRHNQGDFDTLDDYLGYRIEDFGMNLWSTIIRYALNIPALHQDIEDSLVPLTVAAFKAVVLIDDCMLHNKDLIITASPVNAVTVKQKLFPGMSFANVKVSILNQDVLQAQRIFRVAKVDWEQQHAAETDPSASHARDYLQGLFDYVAGYYAWAQTCPWYP